MQIVSDGQELAIVVSGFGEDDTGGGLFLVDGGRVERLDYVSSNGVAVAGDRFVRTIRSAREVESVGELLVYDKRGVERYFRVDALADAHDVAWDGENYVAVSTLTNKVLWISPGGDVVREWRAPGAGDCWHLNSLFVHDGTVYVSAFGRYRRHREWAEQPRDGAGFVLDLETGREVLTGLSSPHTPRRFDGAWTVCNSAAGEVVQLDAEGEVVRRVELGGWTRGIAVSDDLVFVGVSAARYGGNAPETANVAVLSRTTWDVVGRFLLPCREVYDVVLVPTPLVEGLRRGFRTNGSRVEEQDQYALFREVGVTPSRLWACGDPLPLEAMRARIAAELPDALTTDELVEVECSLENLGNAILVSAPPNRVILSYRWFDPETGRQLDGGAPLRSPLPAPAPPRRPLQGRLRVLAPSVPGEFLLRVTLVQEGVAWFDDVDERSSCARIVFVTQKSDDAAS